MSRSRRLADLVDKTLASVKQQAEDLVVPESGAIIAEAVGSSELTGVGKYLATLPNVTKVSKYMDNVQDVSRVSKYIKRQELTTPPTTGVAKYIIKQNYAAKGSVQMSGVAKYSVNLRQQSKPSTTVAKYIARLSVEANRIKNLTGVAKYQAEKDLEAKKSAAASLVARYQELDTELLKQKQAALASAMPEPTEVDNIDEAGLTGVALYAYKQAKLARNKPSVSSVARYVAQMIIEERSRPPLSGVGRYVKQLQKRERQKPVLSGVGRYLKALPPIAKVQKASSGVERYLAQESQQTKPVESRVAKYIVKQEHEQVQQKIIEEANKPKLPGTGLSRYLEVLNAEEQAIALAKRMQSMTRVDKYLLGVA